MPTSCRLYLSCFCLLTSPWSLITSPFRRPPRLHFFSYTRFHTANSTASLAVIIRLSLLYLHLGFFFIYAPSQLLVLSSSLFLYLYSFHIRIIPRAKDIMHSHRFPLPLFQTSQFFTLKSEPNLLTVQ